MVNRLVERYGRTGFAALSSIIWALPMAAWAGPADLSPVDKTPYPRVALSVGTEILLVWFVPLIRLRRGSWSPPSRRFDLAQMSTSTKRTTLSFPAFLT